jgi:nicotinate-nucleotide pyrophosphorylase (carboxylating)
MDAERLRRLVEMARAEDLGQRGDITTQSLDKTLLPKGPWRLVARHEGIFAGAAVLPTLLHELAADARLREGTLLGDGERLAAGQVAAIIEGDAEQVLPVERILLNFLQRLCGVATLTRRFVDAVAGTSAIILDTRKTIPGWRDLDKYAVRCGGGHNHRLGLHDAVLIKDNHLAGVPIERLAAVVFGVLNRALALRPPPAFVAVEVDRLEQLEELFKVVGIDVVLLDNFTPEQARRAVERRDAVKLGGKLALEVSGGVTLANVRTWAETGVERISVGALTHSAAGLDLGLDAEP